MTENIEHVNLQWEEELDGYVWFCDECYTQHNEHPDIITDILCCCDCGSEYQVHEVSGLKKSA